MRKELFSNSIRPRDSSEKCLNSGQRYGVNIIELIDFDQSDTTVVHRHSTDDVPLINVLKKEDFNIDNQNR